MLIYDMPDTLHVIKYDVNIWHARYSTCNKVSC